MLPLLRTVAVLALACVAAASGAGAAPSTPCGDSGYSYAGLAGAGRAYGVSAAVQAAAPPRVQGGHVAAWVGVGGYGLGRNGQDAWLQAGLITKVDGSSVVYYEVTRPGYRPELVTVRGARAGRAYRVAVLELAGRPGWWTVLVDGKAVTAPISLPGSHGAWEPTATAESWDGGTPVCNRFRFTFADVAVARSPGGGWEPFGRAAVLQSPGHRVARTPAGFVAAA